MNSQITNLLEHMRLPGQSDSYSGKIRKTFSISGRNGGNSLYVSVSTDNISAFDIVFPFTVKDKGRVLHLISTSFMKEAQERGIPIAQLESANSRTSIEHKCIPLKIEVIIRQYLAGSMWRNYKNGQREFWGTTLPDGMKQNQKLPEIMITPTTKADIGSHDEDITVEQIIKRNIVTESQWNYISLISKQIFQLGVELAEERGLILVDTKYEFGERQLATYPAFLMDELHTPDSSRYWIKNEYQERFDKNEEQNQISKEFFRVLLMEKYNFHGKEGQKIPDISKEDQKLIEEKYKEFYRLIMGHELPEEDAGENDPVQFRESIKSVLRRLRVLDKPLVGIIMGSESDMRVMRGAIDMLEEEFDIPFIVNVVSAHRTPEKLQEYVAEAKSRGIKVIIAGAGGAAHLPGMIAAWTTSPVIGVPVKSSNSIDGWDSILSILQMPTGVPVATVALDASANAALLAIQILGTSDAVISSKLEEYKKGLKRKVQSMDEKTGKSYPQ